MPAKDCPTSRDSIDEGAVAPEARCVQPEASPVSAERPDCIHPRFNDLPDRACENLCLLYQGVRACVGSPYSRSVSERAAVGDRLNDGRRTPHEPGPPIPRTPADGLAPSHGGTEENARVT